jgi:hypothetical protein
MELHYLLLDFRFFVFCFQKALFCVPVWCLMKKHFWVDFRNVIKMQQKQSAPTLMIKKQCSLIKLLIRECKNCKLLDYLVHSYFFKFRIQVFQINNYICMELRNWLIFRDLLDLEKVKLNATSDYFEKVSIQLQENGI